MWLFSVIPTLTGIVWRGWWYPHPCCNERDRCMLCSSGETFFTLPALVFNLNKILHFVATYDHSSLFSELCGSVTKPHVRRMIYFFSYQDVFPHLASCFSFAHLPVFSRELYEVKNIQHQRLLLPAIYLVLPAAVVQELHTPASAARWSPWGTRWEGRGLLPPVSCVNQSLLLSWQKFSTAWGWLKSLRTWNVSLLKQKEKTVGK